MFDDFLDNFFSFSHSFNNDLLDDFIDLLSFNFDLGGKVFDLFAHMFGEDVSTFEVGGEFDKLLSDSFDDLLCFRDLLFDQLTDDFVDLLNLHLQLCSNSSQIMADFCGEDIFAGDNVDEFSFNTREKVFLDCFNDFLGLGDSFHNQISDECIYFCSINFDKGSDFVDLGADSFIQDLFAFEVMYESFDFCTDKFDDILSLGDSFFNCFTDSFVNFSNFHFQDGGSFFQSFADVVSQNIFTDDDVLDELSFNSGKKVMLDCFNDFLGLGDSFHNQISDECIYFSSINLDKGSNFVDLGTDSFIQDLFAFEVMYERLDFCTDECDDFLGLGQSFVKGFTDSCVNFFNFHFQDLGSFSQSFADVDVDLSREKVFLDLFNDFLDLGDSFGNDLLHDLHHFCHLDLQFCGNLSNFVANVFGESISTFEVLGHLDKFGLDNLEDLFGFGNSFCDSFTDDFVNFGGLDFEHLGSISQFLAHSSRKNIFTGDDVDEFSFNSGEKVFLDGFNDFLGFGDSFHNQISDECINFSSINLDKGSNFVDLGADSFIQDLFAFEVMYERLDFCTDECDDFLGL